MTLCALKKFASIAAAVEHIEVVIRAEGRRAYRAGMSVFEVPYHPASESDEWMSWVVGWGESRNEDLEARAAAGPSGTDWKGES